jgi:Flp pilus assembly protein TadD
VFRTSSLPALAACLLAACGPGETASPAARAAFLTVENLTGDPSLDWMSRALPAIAVAQLAGGARVAAFTAHTVPEAHAGVASQLVHGTLDRRAGKLRAEFFVEDARSHRMVRTAAFEGLGVLETADRLAKWFDPSAGPFSSTNPEAVEAWGRQDFARAVELDPDFGAAWFGWAQAERERGQPGAALEIAARALARPGLRSPLDQANLRVLEATLRGDSAARDGALADLLRLTPHDAQLARSLAESAFNARRFRQAAEFFQAAIRANPSDRLAYNLLGYALAFQGDLDGARRAFEEYAKEPGERANALDSEGEALFLHGRFAEAERYFLDAHEADPARHQGDDLRKAAYARWLAGDLAAADRLFERYLQFMSAARDQAIEWRRAAWLYSTGRQSHAMDLLAGVRGPAEATAKAQLEIWRNPERVPSDVEELARIYEQTPPGQDGLMQVLYARALLRSGRREEAARLLSLYPLPGTGDPLLQSLVFPLYLELRAELGRQGAGYRQAIVRPIL